MYVHVDRKFNYISITINVILKVINKNRFLKLHYICFLHLIPYVWSFPITVFVFWTRESQSVISHTNAVLCRISVIVTNLPLCMSYNLLEPRSHCPGFQSRRRYGMDTGAHRDHTVATAASTALNQDTPVLNRRSQGCGSGGFKKIKPPELTGTPRAAKQHRLILRHHRSSSGMNRISTVRPPVETVANRHELIPR